MNDRDDIDMLAAEYVLGTLDAQERDTVAHRRQQEPELDAMIVAWQERLAALGDEVREIEPGPSLLARIEQRIEALEATPSKQDSTASDAVDSRIEALRKRLRLWQWSTGLASAAALALIAILLSPLTQTPEPRPFIAVFQQDDQQPAFMMSLDLDSQQLHVKAVTAEPMSGKSYQLWIKEDSLGPKPHSVGVLDDNLTLETAALSQYDPALLKAATFGISIEPAGGSPTGQPTGPAIHGQLYATDQQNL
ncbi:anti-sigma factor [Halomonas huangheensis]|uniref:Anti-sigma K factor RskA C-terminal domain-containing protein n=1 Tax=Halomonas huangheensis TaxID=1178482 RepID=W1N8T8_9GAMM|nr:anti-sigma factor [Halomonas huangheensis]ALM53359.1 hypothetical protein AR456_14555 [Halomonas huangheensis]ERL51992.1 hypothetical protein BJB45_12555 [Halomonas huangheensis]